MSIFIRLDDACERWRAKDSPTRGIPIRRIVMTQATLDEYLVAADGAVRKEVVYDPEGRAIYAPVSDGLPMMAMQRFHGIVVEVGEISEPEGFRLEP